MSLRSGGGRGGAGTGGAGSGTVLVASGPVLSSTITGPIALTGIGHLEIHLDTNPTLSFIWPPGLHAVELLIKDLTGGHTVTWGDVDRWGNGVEPIIPNGAGDETSLALMSPNGGTTVTGFHGQTIQTVWWSTPEPVEGHRGDPFPLPRRSRLLSARLAADVAGAGGSTTVKLEANGTDVWNATPANRATLAAAATLGAIASTFDTATLANNTVLVPEFVDVPGTAPTRCTLLLRYLEV